MIKLVFLGKFRALAGDGFDVELPSGVATLADLTAWLAKREPALGEAIAGTRTQFVLNQKIMRDPAERLHDGDEIAFLPPMSGG